MRTPRSQSRQEFAERYFTLPKHHDVSATAEVLVGIVSRLRTSQHHCPVMGLGSDDNIEHGLACHQVSVDAHRPTRPGL
jgi:hypothetical protein